jgi:hypothetical protein
MQPTAVPPHATDRPDGHEPALPWMSMDLQDNTPDRPNAELESRAEEICSRLLIDRWLPKRNFRDLLLDDELRQIVSRRLSGVGLQLVESFTSDFFAVRLKRDVESDISFDWATNTRLPRGSVALLVILWATLVLPKRIASSEAAFKRQLAQAQASDDTPQPVLPGIPLPPVEPEPPVLITVQREALYAEFGRKFGKTAFARYLGQLKTAGFVKEDRQGRLREGPLLDLLVDGVQMAQKLRDSVLWDVLERGPGALDRDEEGAEEAEDFEEPDE